MQMSFLFYSRLEFMDITKPRRKTAEKAHKSSMSVRSVCERLEDIDQQWGFKARL